MHARSLAIVTATATYHVAAGRCTKVVARSGTVLWDHVALGMDVVSAFRLDGRGQTLATSWEPRVGDCVCFFGRGRSFVTAPIAEVREPAPAP